MRRICDVAFNIATPSQRQRYSDHFRRKDRRKNQHLTVTHEYNFLGNIIDNKGNLKRSIQELSKKWLKVLFALKRGRARN
jgi:hypothetical protein